MPEAVYKSGPPFPFGAVDRAHARQFLLFRGVDAANLGAYEGLGYLLRAAPFDRSARLELPGPLPFGGVDRRQPRHTTIQGKTVTIHLAATGDAARSTASDDTPANQWVGPHFDGQFNYEIELFSPTDPTQRSGTASVGILTLNDTEGDLDYLRRLGWPGATLQIMRGNPASPFSAWSVVADLTAAGITYDRTRKEIAIRDLEGALTAAELHGQRYLGTGGMEGDESVKGNIKPLALGRLFNVAPKLIGADKLLYQVSCSSVRTMLAAKDGGAEITPAADHDSFESLDAATIAGGTFETCKALGVFRLGSKPVFPVTVDLEGDNDTINGLGYPHTRAQIARRIATGRGTVRLVDPRQIDAAAYKALEQQQPATLGYYWDSEISKADALTEVMAGCLGWWFIRLDGRLVIGQLQDPTAAAPALSLVYPTEGATTESRLGDIVNTAIQPPVRVTMMGWARNYTKLNTNQIALDVAASDSAILQAESRYTRSPDPWVAANYPSSPVVTRDGGFAFEADAQREGDRQQRLRRVPRETFELPAVLDPAADFTGRVLTVDQLDRFDFGASKPLFVFGAARNEGAWTVLKLWG